MADLDAYYDSLFGPELGKRMSPDFPGKGGLGIQLSPGGGKPGDLSFLDKIKTEAGKHKGAIGSILAFMLLNKYLETRNLSKEQGIQREGMQAQAGLATPENLYYQAAQPQAREEATMARYALMSQITGGVLGPSLARGERRIGGG